MNTDKEPLVSTERGSGIMYGLQRIFGKRPNPLSVFVLLFSTECMARAGWSDPTTPYEGWIFVTLIFSPLALTLALFLGIIVAVATGQKRGNWFRPSLWKGALMFFGTLATYVIGTAVYALVYFVTH